MLTGLSRFEPSTFCVYTGATNYFVTKKTVSNEGWKAIFNIIKESDGHIINSNKVDLGWTEYIM